MENGTSSSKVQASETTLAIIETLQSLDGGRINEVAEVLDTSPSTVHRHLNTLLENCYVTKKGDEYHLGMQFLMLGGAVQNRDSAFQIAETKVTNLAEQTGERVQFIVEEHGYRFYVHTETGERAVQTDSRIGKRGYLHCSAAGKAILANLPEEYVKEIILHRGLPPVTPNTITDEDEIYSEINTIQEMEIALNLEESTEGLNAVGTAITGPHGSVIGGISISGPAHRLKGDTLKNEIGNNLLGAANEIELKIQYR